MEKTICRGDAWDTRVFDGNFGGCISLTIGHSWHWIVYRWGISTGYFLWDGVLSVICPLVSLSRAAVESSKKLICSDYACGGNIGRSVCESGLCNVGFENDM